MSFHPGQRVRLVSGWLDDSSESGARFIVVEDNGDRVVIELVCDLPIPPRELVRPSMITPAEEDQS